MPSKSTQSLEDLRAQARLSFRYWHIYLMLRLREVEQHLNPSERQSFAASPTPLALPPASYAILLDYGLWTNTEQASDMSNIPHLALPPAQRYFFRMGASLNARGFLPAFVSLDAVALQSDTLWRLELLRVPVAEADALNLAGALFERIAAELSLDLALESARLWALLHGARLLSWTAVPAQHCAQFAPQAFTSVSAEPAPPSTTTPTPALPTRRRGKGQFREPN